MEFVKLVKISGNRFSIRTDDIDDVKTLWRGHLNLVCYILVVSVGSDKYYLDLGRLMNDHTPMLQAENIAEIVGQLTSEMLYGYQTNLFHMERPVRSFTSSDLPNQIVISPYNHHHGGESATTYDPNFQDLVVRSTDQDLNEIFPVIDGSVKRCSWIDNQIVIKDQVALARTTTQLNFLSFAGMFVSTMSLRELVNNGVVPEDKIPILVLGGTLYYDDPWVYQFYRDRRLFQLNDQFLDERLPNTEHVTKKDLIDDPDSFVIMVEAKNLFTRDISLVSMITDHKKFYTYFEPDIWQQHTDYICIDRADHKVRGMAAFSESYLNVAEHQDSNEHHVYIDGPGHREVRLTQLVVC